MRTIDLNADLGEGGHQDPQLMQIVSSCNIACGGHAGDVDTMRAAVDAALAAGIVIGAHPGYEDPAHFGRRELNLSPSEVRSLLHRQIERLMAIHRGIHHVKPHGALYHQANQDPGLASTVCEAIHDLLPGTTLYAPPQGELRHAADRVGLKFCAEGFIDRAYLADGTLCPRSSPEAMIETAEQAVDQALQLARDGQVRARDGTIVSLAVQTLCIHGDTADSLRVLREVRQHLEAAGIQIHSRA